MFENIHFIKQHLDRPITYNNYSSTLPSYFDESFLDSSINNYLTFLKGDFLIDGTTNVCFPHPPSAFALEHLFYIQNFCLFESNENYHTKRENIDSFLLLYTLDGSGSLTYEGKTYTLSRGDGFLIDCQNPHLYKTSGKHWIHADMHFKGSFSEKIYHEYTQNGTITFSQANIPSFPIQFEKLINLYDDVLRNRELYISNLLENILMMLLDYSTSQVTNNPPENIKYLIRYIENNYMKSLTLDYLSDFAGISKYHMIRLFNKYVGTSPRDFILQLQIQNAKKLLETTSLPANKIGVIVGIKNENYFNHIFKSKVGVSPGAYRKQCKSMK